uniref:hypothetical protein n=1 Tax=uncultured Mucilaginibacter sp. TaxID=797541 RepID=UPI0025DD3D69
SDSIYTSKNKTYAKTINKLTNDQDSVKIGNKEYGFLELLKLYNQVEDKNYVLRDSIRLLKEINILLNQQGQMYKKIQAADGKYENILRSFSDTAGVNYKSLYNLAKKEYGFDFIVKKDTTSKHGVIISSKFGRADSAALLFKYFRNRLKETKPGYFVVDLSGNK